MKKKMWIISLIIACVITFCPVISEAGTYMVGVKGWFASWDSAVLDWFEKDIAAGFMDNGIVLMTEKDPGTGYLSGPLLSYQSGDGKWSFSLALMVISSFSQDWKGSATGMDIDSSLGVDRMDFDFAVNYSLYKYMKVFVGYKHQIVDMDFKLSYDTLMGRREFDYTLGSDVKIPAAGVGFVYPAYDKLVLGLQLGVLYAIPELSITDDEDKTYDIWPRPNLGFNGEISLNYQPYSDWIVQLGYRYQIFQLEARSPERWEIKTVSNDITHGITISAVYVF